MRVERSVLLPCAPQRCFEAVQTPRLLEYVAKPMLRFVPLAPSTWPARWEPKAYLVAVRFLGLLPIGRQWVNISGRDRSGEFGHFYVELRDDGRGALLRCKPLVWLAKRRVLRLTAIPDSLGQTGELFLATSLPGEPAPGVGKNGNAGHAGHLFASDNQDALCGCGNVGDVEGLVAGNAIARRFAALGFADAAALLIAARGGSAQALAIVEDLCRVMGRTLYKLVVTLDLQRISLGGSVFWHHRDFLLPKLREQVHGKLSPLTDGCDLVEAALGDKVGDYAALVLVTS